MQNTNVATYDVFNPEMSLDGGAGSTGHALYPIDSTRRNENLTAFQVKEDQASYVPDFPSGKRYGGNPQAHSAAADHAKHLQKAGRLLDEALNLAGLMLASLDDECDGRAMQTETALKVIEKKLGKAHTQIDRHRRRHTNLFLAHFDLRDKKKHAEAS